MEKKQTDEQSIIQCYVAMVYLFKCKLFMKAKIKLASQPLRSPELKQDRVYSSTKQIAPTISQMCRVPFPAATSRCKWGRRSWDWELNGSVITNAKCLTVAVACGVKSRCALLILVITGRPAGNAAQRGSFCVACRC